VQFQVGEMPSQRRLRRPLKRDSDGDRPMQELANESRVDLLAWITRLDLSPSQ